MERKLYLEGELADKYGHSMTVHAESVRDALRILEVNNPDFKQYLIDSTERGIDFGVEIAGEEIEYDDELLLPLTKGDITITAIPAGSGGGFKKVVLGLMLLAVVLFVPVAGASLVSAMQSFVLGGTLTAHAVIGFALTFTGLSLAMVGLQEMMIPDPATDNDQESSYLFNGAEQNLIEGDPVPVLYGRLQIPGQPVNFEVTNANPASSYGFGMYNRNQYGASGGGIPSVWQINPMAYI
tara:strand:+ start:874 stop:1590 length:717 start_codon:yes stop_codon:yes gene_type:complete